MAPSDITSAADQARPGEAGQVNRDQLAVLNLISKPIWVWDLEEQSPCWANQAAVAFWDEEKFEALPGRSDLISSATQDWVTRSWKLLAPGQSTHGHWVTRSETSPKNSLCRVTPVTIDRKRPAVLVELLANEVGEFDAVAESVMVEHRISLLTKGQLDILASLGRDFSLAKTLEKIATVVETCVSNSRCSLLLFGPDKCARFGTSTQDLAPVLQEQLQRRCAKTEAAQHDGADASDQELLVDFLDDPSQASALREAALTAGLQTCWARPVLSSSDEPLGILALYLGTKRLPDVTDQQILEAMASLARLAVETDHRKTALQSANDRFASLAASVPGVVYQRKVTPDGDIRYTYISEGARELFGVSPEEIVADPQALFDRHGSEYYATFRDRLIAASKALKMWDVEATIVTRDGKRKFTHAIARPHRQADGSVLWDGIILDATRIKEAELAAAATEGRTRNTIIESIPQGFALFDEDDKLVTHNSHYLNLYPTLQTIIEPGVDYEAISRAEILQDPLNGPEELSTEERLAIRLEHHKLQSHVVERHLADGRWILANEKRTDSGGTVVLHTDVTELKLREQELQRSNEELQNFASVASHDLQEPLRKIEAFGDRLSKAYGDRLDETGANYIERMQSAATRMRTLINDLLTYSRVTTQASPFIAVDLEAVARDVVDDLQARLEEGGGKVELGDLTTLEADPLQMRMLLQNLLVNALKFSREGVAPLVKVSARILEPPRPDTVAQCEIVVSDNGIGFEEVYAERIFGIFQRLHGREEYEGTGIGLATCRKIAERHAGSIKAKSVPGEGATFSITLPAKQSVPEASS